MCSVTFCDEVFGFKLLVATRCTSVCHHVLWLCKQCYVYWQQRRVRVGTKSAGTGRVRVSYLRERVGMGVMDCTRAALYFEAG